MSPVARRRVGGAVIAALSAMLFSTIECLRPSTPPEGERSRPARRVIQDDACVSDEPGGGA
jgi:hypothetical protein